LIRRQDASIAIDRKAIEEGEMYGEAFSGDAELEA
jgi:hypothetical protein